MIDQHIYNREREVKYLREVIKKKLGKGGQADRLVTPLQPDRFYL